MASNPSVASGGGGSVNDQGPQANWMKGPPSTWPAEARRGMAWRVGATVLLITGWLVFLLVYAFFWSGPYSLFQDVIVVIVSLVALGGGMAGVWASWGMRFAGMGDERCG